MKKRVVLSIILAMIMGMGIVVPVFAGSPAKDFNFRLNVGSNDYDLANKQDRAYYADIFPQDGNVSKSAYIVFNIAKYKDGELKYLTYSVAKQDLTPMKIWYKASVNMDDIQWQTLRLYANRYGQGTIAMNGVWYP